MGLMQLPNRILRDYRDYRDYREGNGTLSFKEYIANKNLSYCAPLGAPVTVDNKYYLNDTKDNHVIKLTPEKEAEWQAGFDEIDISPKDGKLSTNEICDYREKETKFWCFKNLSKWREDPYQTNKKGAIEKLDTEYYRNNF